MSKFTNTSYKKTIDALVTGLQKKLDNPHYLYSDKKPTSVTYFNQNKTKSTLDEGSKLSYAPLGNNSPARYNKINDTYLYGMGIVPINLELGDFGIEAGVVDGEALVLPNTFEPLPEDFFYVNYLNKNMLFKVTTVSLDTLENGANFHKITYILDQSDYQTINDQVVDEFTMIINNVGTQFNSVIRSNDYNLIENIESITERLKTYYINLFFNRKVQTFTYLHDDDHFYDSYMIEFLIRNKILEGGDEYIYVSHAHVINNTFCLEYDKTFFRSIELKNKNFNSKSAYAVIVNSPNSLLSTRLEDYFSIDYMTGSTLSSPVSVVDVELIENIRDNILFSNEDKREYYNIIIKYLNDGSFNSDTIRLIENIDYNNNISLFYNIPIIIYILEHEIKKLLIK